MEDWFERITKLLAALAGLIGFVYLVGAGVLWVRLWRDHLPTEAVITSLPRELLLSIGLRSIFLPAVGFGLFACGVLFIVAKTDKAPAEATNLAEGTQRFLSTLKLLILTWLWVATLLTGTAFVLLWLVGPGFTWALGWVLGALVVVVVSAVIGSSLTNDLRSLRALALVALLVGGVATLMRLGVEVANPQFENAAVCPKDANQAYRGLFIGETDNGIFLGLRDKKRVIEIPRDRFSEVWIGKSTGTCPAIVAAGQR